MNRKTALILAFVAGAIVVYVGISLYTGNWKPILKNWYNNQSDINVSEKQK